MSKPNYGFRLDKKLVDKCRVLEIDLADLFENAMEKLLNERTCPMCKSKVKPNKRKPIDQIG